MTYLLDTSALMAHVLSEPGWEIVEGILADYPRDAAISAITWLEFNIVARLISDRPAEAKEVLALYDHLLAVAIPATREVAEAALGLRLIASKRLPTAGALIAATAKLHGATLVHRDPHLAVIPQKLLKQIVLPAKN
jgi:predicted nucleic acid-binding protein